MDKDLEEWLSYIQDITPLSKLDKHHITPTKDKKLRKTKIDSKHYSITSKIDLHGLTQDQAFEQLKVFLKQSCDANKKEVVIITGKGKINQPGLIKTLVPRWLEHTELKRYVLGYSYIQDTFGESGAIRVLIRK